MITFSEYWEKFKVTIAGYEWILALAIGFAIFSPIITRFLIASFYKITKSKKTAKQSVFYIPLRNMIALTGVYIAFEMLNLEDVTSKMLKHGFKIIVIAIFAKSLADSIARATMLSKRLVKQGITSTFIVNIIKVFIYLVAGFMIIAEFGYDLSGLATGLGIGSAVIALAAQDLAKSIIGGFTIISEKMFKVGDWIEVNDHAGTVRDITFRSTIIQTANNAFITIPNSTITTECVLNWSRLKERRFETTISATLETPPEKVLEFCEKLRIMLAEDIDVRDDSVQVHVSAIGNGTDIFIYLYITRTNYTEFLDVKERLVSKILVLANDERIDLAYDTKTIFLAK